MMNKSNILEQEILDWRKITSVKHFRNSFSESIPLLYKQFETNRRTTYSTILRLSEGAEYAGSYPRPL